MTVLSVFSPGDDIDHNFPAFEAIEQLSSTFYRHGSFGLTCKNNEQNF